MRLVSQLLPCLPTDGNRLGGSVVLPSLLKIDLAVHFKNPVRDEKDD